jgi:hypothetical protein
MPSLITLESIEKKEWSDEQLARRKKLGAASSIATSTLGLGALGVLALRSKPAGRAIKEIGEHAPKAEMFAGKKVGHAVGSTGGRLEKLRSAAKGAETPILATSAGIGGLGVYNYAAIQRQESKKAKRHNAEYADLKNKVNRLDAAVHKVYDPEEERHKQNKIAAGVLAAGGAGSIAAAVPQAQQALHQKGRIKNLKTKPAKARAGRIMRVKGGKAALLALGGAGAIGGGVKLATNERSRRGKTYSAAYRPQYY